MADQATTAAGRSGRSGRSIEDDIAALREDLKILTSDVAGLAKEKGDSIRADIGAKADKAMETGRQATESMQDTVRERPLTSVFVAFGVGILLGHLLDRR